jgi:hypothetical protein
VPTPSRRPFYVGILFIITMRLYKNEITLTRRECKALGVPSRHVLASEIGRLWRSAEAEVTASRERVGPIDSGVVLIPGVGVVVAHTKGYYELQQLDKRQERLDSVEHMALAIEMETMGLDA